MNGADNIATEMVDCRSKAVVVGRGGAAACAAHQYELAAALASVDDGGLGLDVAPPGAVCGQHLRVPETVEAILPRIDAATESIWFAAPNRRHAEDPGAFRTLAAELVTLAQALVGAADAERAEHGHERVFTEYLRDVAPGGER